MFLFGNKKKHTNTSTSQKPTNQKLTSIQDLRFPACIFARQILKTQAQRLLFPDWQNWQELQETNTSGWNCAAAKQLSLCSVIPQLHCTVKWGHGRRTSHLVKVKSCPTKPRRAWMNLHSVRICTNCYEKNQKGKILKMHKEAVELTQKVKE